MDLFVPPQTPLLYFHMLIASYNKHVSFYGYDIKQ